MMLPIHSASLAITLVGENEIMIRRQFAAPRTLVFKAFTSCEHLSRWLGPRQLVMTECEMEFSPGGRYRYSHRDPGGSVFTFFGEILEIDPPGKIVQTFGWDGMPTEVSVDTLTLEDHDGGTRLTVVSRFSSREARDGMAQSGMEEGVRDSYERLEAYLDRLGEI